MTMKVTLRDVAAQVGVSPTTVSSALRGKGRMTDVLRKHINETAHLLGYQVDPIISAGMAQMRKRPERRMQSVLAWLDATPERDTVEKMPVLSLLWRGAFTQAAEMGYDLQRFWLNEPGISPNRLAAILRARGIGGVLVKQYFEGSISESAPEVNFDFSGFACVSAGSRLGGPDIPWAQADLFACTSLALRELRVLGYRRIGLVWGVCVDARTDHRISSAYEGFIRLHPEMIRLPIFVDESKDERKRLLTWLKTEKPDVVLSCKPPDEIRSLGFRVPEDIGVCTLDHFNEFGDCAGVYQNHSEIGAAAVRMLQAQLQQRLRGIPEITTATMVEGRWIPGASLRNMNVSPPRKSCAKSQGAL